MLFTPQELEEMRRADAEIEADFRQTPDEIRASRRRDRAVKLERLDNRGRRSAESKKAYREANREKIAESQKAYYEANREKIAESQKDLLRNYRKNLGLFQKKFAALLGVTQGLISQWELGMVPINLFLIDSVFPDLGDALRKGENNGHGKEVANGT